MPIDINDAARLNDVIRATEAVALFIQGHTEASYEQDLLLRSAVERQVEIVGEACRGISAAFKDIHPEVPWKKIVSTRHILAHDYGMIKNDILWRIATVYLPELRSLLLPLLPAPPASNS